MGWGEDLGLTEYVIIHSFFSSFFKGPETFLEETLGLHDGPSWRHETLLLGRCGPQQ